MDLDANVPRSRRAVLAASVGGAAALLAQALGRPMVADAANGDAVTVGGSFSGTAPTTITNAAGDAVQAINSATSGSGLVAHATAATGTTYGVFSQSDSTDGTGVLGVGALSGVVGGASGHGRGVYGWNDDEPYGVGVYGQAGRPAYRVTPHTAPASLGTARRDGGFKVLEAIPASAATAKWESE